MIISDFRGKFHDQMNVDATPAKTQKRLVEMLDKYVPPTPTRLPPTRSRLSVRRPLPQTHRPPSLESLSRHL